MIIRHAAFLVFALLALSLPCCTSDPVTPDPGDIQVTASPQQTSTSEAVRFTLAYSSIDSTISSSRIDYDGNGTWDDFNTHGGTAILAEYEHLYASGGTYPVTAQMLDGAEVRVSASRRSIPGMHT